MIWSDKEENTLHNIKMRANISSTDKTTAVESIPKLTKMIEESGYISNQIFKSDKNDRS